MRIVNVFEVETETGPGRDGFWFSACQLGPKLGAARLGAGLYEAREGVPIWPYHYHYPAEEWLQVLDGTPVLRDSGGRRRLETGDVVCFPPGHRGAHTLEGPGRFIIFSARSSPGPFVSVYPDSDKVSVFPGFEPDRLNALLLPRAGSVDYWHREGRGTVEPASVTREPDAVPGPPVVNVHSTDARLTDGSRWVLGDALGAAQLDAAVVELDPEASDGPYHYQYGREMWLLALAGTPTLRHAEGKQELAPGDLICLPEGPAGGRSIANRGLKPVRVLMLWTTGLPAAVCYPDTGDWTLRAGSTVADINLRGT